MLISKDIATFKITHTQCLGSEGSLTQPLPSSTCAPDLLLALYENMVLSRLFDKKAISLQRTGRLGTYPSILGQEALGAAIGMAMAPNDVFCPYYRDVGAHLLRGVRMEELFLYWGGDERGSQFLDNSEDFPHAVPISSQILHATGVAAAMKLRNQPRCAVVTVGDGGTSKGDFYEGLNLAGAWQLPVVFVINNNQWAISMPRTAQSNTQTLAQKGIAAGIEAYQVDGNDVVALHHMIKQAVHKATHQKSPSLIEAVTYRLTDHTTADDASRYRKNTDIEKAEQEEPIRRLRQYLMHNHLWDALKESNLIQLLEKKVSQASDNYLQTSPQSPEAMFDSLYETLPVSLIEQRDDLMLYGEIHEQ